MHEISSMENARSSYQKKRLEASSKDIDIFEKTRVRKKHDYVNAKWWGEKQVRKNGNPYQKKILQTIFY